MMPRADSKCMLYEVSDIVVPVVRAVVVTHGGIRGCDNCRSLIGLEEVGVSSVCALLPPPHIGLSDQGNRPHCAHSVLSERASWSEMSGYNVGASDGDGVVDVGTRSRGGSSVRRML